MPKRRQRNTVNDQQRANTIKPEAITQKQADYLDALQHYTQTFSLGPAGTGKTFLAASQAAYLYLRGEIDSIRLTRPGVEVEEKWGHLPGGIDKKTEPWAKPVMEVLEECLGGNTLTELRKAGQITVEPLAFMRGRTFDRTFVLMDEAQNVSPAQMQMFLTRIGKGTRIAVNGDTRQCDLRRESGLAMALRMIRQHGIPARVVEFTSDDVARSGICQQWVKAFEAESDA